MKIYDGMLGVRHSERTLFRGIGGMKLPDCFYVEDETGVRGGVERVLLSTTTQPAVAMHYMDGRD